MKTTAEIKLEIHKKTKGYPINEIMCSNCKSWGGNNGKVIYIADSQCAHKHKRTSCFQFCKYFDPVKWK